MMSTKRTLKLLLLMMTIFAVILSCISCNTATLNNNQTPSGIVEKGLPRIGSYEKLLSILKKHSPSEGYGYRDEGGAAKNMGEAPSAEQSSDRSSGTNNDHSKTNTQTEGVDEADIVKTDGKYIYQVNGNRIFVIQAIPADNMKLVAKVTLEDLRFIPLEMYLDDKYLTVIGSTGRAINSKEEKVVPPVEPSIEIQPPYKEAETWGSSANIVDSIGSVIEAEPPVDYVDETDTQSKLEENSIVDIMPRELAPDIFWNAQDTTRVIIYDISKPSDLKVVRDFEMDGYYVSSRKIDDQLYLISNRYVYYYPDSKLDENALAPQYRDSAENEDFITVDYESIRYFPESKDTNYLMIAGINLDKPDGKADISVYLGSGQTVYASKGNLYIAMTNWEYENMAVDIIEDAPMPVEAQEAERKASYTPPKITTSLYRFGLNDGVVTFSATGQVPGMLINQFSMDEHEDHLRVATTTGEAWRNDELTSKNNIYILDSSMKLTGKVEDIAPGERIYSVRFLGDKGYMVTFKTVDPLFVLDLKNPKAPKILGELKIPGYSDYLHPYDENHIIGFGMDTVEADIKDFNGKVIGSNAYQMGMKIALFDVSDVNNPIEKFSLKIGGRGTSSEVLYNHKALLYNNEKSMMAFPINVYEAKEQWLDRDKTMPNYGEFTFQGLYAIDIDPEKGFSIKAKITHIDDLSKVKYGYYDYNYNISRAIYIGDTIYSISQGMIKANSMIDDYIELDALELN